jgi:hypothetical protein
MDYIFMYQFINKLMYYIINLCINDLIYTLQCNNVLLNTLRSIYYYFINVLSLYYFISILIFY